MHKGLLMVFYAFNTQDANDLGVEKTKDMDLYLPDGCQLFDDEEVTDKEIVGEKMLFMDENPPQLNTCAGIFIYQLA